MSGPSNSDARADALPEAQRALLHELRLRGLMQEFDDAVADALCEVGFAQRKAAFLALTPDGRAAHAAWARVEPESEGEAAARRAYEQFLPLNTELLQVSTDWQIRAGNVPNDHNDVHYDWSVIDRLAALDERAGPIVRRLGTAVDRFGEYRLRLRDAVKKVKEGEHEWFLSPRCDSYHTVWMQMHEDLLLALGLDRAEEEEAHGP
jgi:hypothetical protein